MYGFANINYNGPQTGPGGAALITGADNGLSISSVDSSKIVLGQDVGQAGDPALLLSDRELPMDGFQLNLVNGGLVISDAAASLGTGELFRIQTTAAGAITDNIATIQVDYGNTAADTALLIGTTDTYDPDNAPQYNLLSMQRNSAPMFTFSNLGDLLIQDPLDSASGFYFQQKRPDPIIGNAGSFRIQMDYNYASSTGSVYQADIQIRSIVEDVAPASLDYASIYLAPQLQRHSVGQSWGIIYNPFVTNPGAKQIAFENVQGDVYLNSTAGSRIGRTGVHAVRTPTAWLHIGAGGTAAGSAPFKLTSSAGNVLATPEDGAMEYDGDSLFFSFGAQRATVLTSISAGSPVSHAATAAGVTTVYGTDDTVMLSMPDVFIQVIINGQAYSIPGYIS